MTMTAHDYASRCTPRRAGSGASVAWSPCWLSQNALCAKPSAANTSGSACVNGCSKRASTATSAQAARGTTGRACSPRASRCAATLLAPTRSATHRVDSAAELVDRHQAEEDQQVRQSARRDLPHRKRRQERGAPAGRDDPLRACRQLRGRQAVRDADPALDPARL